MNSYPTSLSFDIIDTHNCKTLAIVDTSYYNPVQEPEGNTLQIIVPGYSDPIELLYQVQGVTVLNSNNLGISNAINYDGLLELPDGAYVIKISICGDKFFELTYYRTCLLKCKYDKAVLTLDLSECTNCYSVKKAEKLDTARRYMEGVLANANVCNIKKATKLYEVADKILDEILNCECE